MRAVIRCGRLGVVVDGHPGKRGMGRVGRLALEGRVCGDDVGGPGSPRESGRPPRRSTDGHRADSRQRTRVRCRLDRPAPSSGDPRRKCGLTRSVRPATLARVRDQPLALRGRLPATPGDQGPSQSFGSPSPGRPPPFVGALGGSRRQLLYIGDPTGIPQRGDPNPGVWARSDCGSETTRGCCREDGLRLEDQANAEPCPRQATRRRRGGSKPRPD